MAKKPVAGGRGAGFFHSTGGRRIEAVEEPRLDARGVLRERVPRHDAGQRLHDEARVRPQPLVIRLVNDLVGRRVVDEEPTTRRHDIRIAGGGDRLGGTEDGAALRGRAHPVDGEHLERIVDAARLLFFRCPTGLAGRPGLGWVVDPDHRTRIPAETALLFERQERIHRHRLAE